MTFEEFETRKVVEQQDYSWDVESDAMDWDMAVSGLRMMERNLRELTDQSSHDVE